MIWREERVVVIGAGGYLGAPLVFRVAGLGATALGVDVWSTSPCWRCWHPHRPMIVGNVLGFGDIADVLEYLAPTVVFHLAGFSHIQPAQRDPLPAWDLNVRGTWNVMEACRRYQADTRRLKAVVVSSSNHIYGSLTATAGWRALTEAWRVEELPRPADVYGGSKFCADVIAQVYARSFGLPVIPLRHVNIYGPADPHATHIVTAAMLAAVAGTPFVVKGAGRATKGYLYLDDGLSAYLRCAELAAGGHRAPVNAGAPAISVLDLVRLVAEVSGGPEPVIAPDDTAHADQADYAEALDDDWLRARDWTPRPLREGLALTWEWYKAHGGMTWAQ